MKKKIFFAGLLSTAMAVSSMVCAGVPADTYAATQSLEKGHYYVKVVSGNGVVDFENDIKTQLMSVGIYNESTLEKTINEIKNGNCNVVVYGDSYYHDVTDKFVTSLEYKASAVSVDELAQYVKDGSEIYDALVATVGEKTESIDAHEVNTTLLNTCYNGVKGETVKNTKAYALPTSVERDDLFVAEVGNSDRIGDTNAYVLSAGSVKRLSDALSSKIAELLDNRGARIYKSNELPAVNAEYYEGNKETGKEKSASDALDLDKSPTIFLSDKSGNDLSEDQSWTYYYQIVATDGKYKGTTEAEYEAANVSENVGLIWTKADMIESNVQLLEDGEIYTETGISLNDLVKKAEENLTGKSGTNTIRVFAVPNTVADIYNAQPVCDIDFILTDTCDFTEVTGTHSDGTETEKTVKITVDTEKTAGAKPAVPASAPTSESVLIPASAPTSESAPTPAPVPTSIPAPTPAPAPAVSCAVEIGSPSCGTITVKSEGTVIESGAAVAAGTVLNLTASGMGSYVFGSWSVVGGSVEANIATTTITVTKDLYITAGFTRKRSGSSAAAAPAATATTIRTVTEKDGSLLKNQTVIIGDDRYATDDNDEVLKKGFYYTAKGNLVYARADGKLEKDRIFRVGGHRYKALKSGKIVVNDFWTTEKGNTVYSNANGRIVAKAFFDVDGYTYYAAKSGKILKC